MRWRNASADANFSTCQPSRRNKRLRAVSTAGSSSTKNIVGLIILLARKQGEYRIALSGDGEALLDFRQRVSPLRCGDLARSDGLIFFAALKVNNHAGN